MENNWKGSKGDFGWIEQFDENIFDIISSEGSFIAKDIEGLENAQMFSDAIKVRQQIYCSLPELLELTKQLLQEAKYASDSNGDLWRTDELLYKAHKALNNEN